MLNQINGNGECRYNTCLLYTSYITNFHKDVMVTNVYTVNSKAEAEVVNDFEFIGDDAKIKSVIGDDTVSYTHLDVYKRQVR